MRFLILSILLITNLAADEIKLRVAAYNVEFSKNATAKEIGQMFKPYKLDLIGFNEAPNGDWTKKVGHETGMKYVYVGKISSANHKDKYKTILSRHPLLVSEEHKITGSGWNPSSTVRVSTKIQDLEISFYALHICASKNEKGHAHFLAKNIISKDKSPVTIVTGDFNNRIEDKAISYILDAGFKDIWKALKINTKDKSTWNALKPKKNEGVIDHIFYQTDKGLKVSDGGIIELDKHLSDHKAVWAEFLIKK